MTTTLGRAPIRAVLDAQNGQVADGCSITLNQATGSLARYLVVVYSKQDEGPVEVGRFFTSPPEDGSPAARIVAIATCPGTRQWSVVVRPAQGFEDDARQQDSVNIAIGCCTPGAPSGVQRVGERSRYYSGTNGVLSILPGQVVTGWAAWSTASVSGTVTFTGVPNGDPITTPPGGSVEGGSNLPEGPFTMTFSGDIGGYQVEYLESA